MGASICLVVAETGMLLTIFDLSALKKQCLIPAGLFGCGDFDR